MSDGGPPFPTLRDYFAAAALPGILSNGTALAALDILADRHDTSTAVLAARDAYRYADAMLAERSKP